MKSFKILSIDGGGIKGLYSARILDHIEKKLRLKFNDPSLRIVDYFDLICGTSSGGLNALALSLRKETSEICSFYDEDGPRIFKKSNFFPPILKQLLLNGKYSDNNLKVALQKMFGNATLSESDSLLCIPSYDFTHGTYALFRYDHTEGNLMRHNNIPYFEVGLATSAAPTYFPLAEIAVENNTQYVDGGVWANNPAMIGYAEAIRHFVGPGKEFDELKILSISSLNIGTGKPPAIKRGRSFRHWARDLFELGLIGQSEFAHFFLNTLKMKDESNFKYFRIPSAVIDSRQLKFIQLDNASKKSLLLMKQFADDMFYKINGEAELWSFFDTKKLYDVKLRKQSTVKPGTHPS
jgi:hypothetical protein